MRNRLRLLGVLSLAGLAAGCVGQDAPKQDGEAETIEIMLDMATEVDAAKVDNASPDYDFDQGRLSLIFTNRGATPLTFPGEAIMLRVSRIYTDVQRGTQQTFNINEPPLNSYKVTRLAPGESWRYGIGFELPDQLLRRGEEVLKVRVCVEWDTGELDTNLFTPGSYDWAEDFNICQDVLIRQ